MRAAIVNSADIYSLVLRISHATETGIVSG